MSRRVSFVSAAAASLLAAATLTLPVGSASAAGSCSGVTVVVDPHQLGGSVQQTCDASGAGKTAAAIFEESGFHLTYSSGGMVCKVNGAPSSARCDRNPPADAYWSLWWANGSSSSWTYSSLGVGSLKIPAGGSVAWSWQEGTSKAKPRTEPTVSAPAPATSPASAAPSGKTTKRPKPKPSKDPAKPTPTVAPSTAAATPSATATPTRVHSRKATPTPSTSPSAAAVPTSASPSASPTAIETATEPTSSDRGGLPGWLAPGLVALLAVVAGGVTWVRRRR